MLLSFRNFNWLISPSIAIHSIEFDDLYQMLGIAYSKVKAIDTQQLIKLRMSTYSINL